MDMYGINSDLISREKISDFGCRKILGLPMPVSAYINGYQAKFPKNDCYITNKKKISSAKSLEFFKKFALAVGAITAGIITISSIIKRKKLPDSSLASDEVVKCGILSKIKNLFSKAKV